MTKRGVSDVVATVIIVALTIVAIAIVWLGVMPIIKDRFGAGDVCSSVDVSIETSQGYTCWASDKNVTLVQIKKGANEINISKIKFVISESGNSISYTNQTNLVKNSYEVFYLNTTEISNVEKIEVVPYVKGQKEERVCASVFIDSITECGTSVLTINEVENVVNSGAVINGEGDSVFLMEQNSPPIINIVSPINNSVYTTSLVWFNFSSDQIVDWEYSLNGATNVSFVENVSAVLVNGNYNITVYASNSNGTSSVFLNFSVDKPCSSQNAQGFYNGSGTLANPYGICNCTMLQNMGSYLNANYSLLNDIDCSMTNTWNGGAGLVPVGTCSNYPTCSDAFSGSFDGRNNTISNLFINLPSSSYVGLFGYVTGSVLNVGLTNLNIVGYNYVGGLVGQLDGSIFNSYSMGSVGGYYYYVGGLVGWANYFNSFSKITNSYSAANVSGYGSFDYVGGLVGYVGAPVSNSYATGNVTGARDYTGGLTGYSSWSVSNSYATGNVNGSRDYVGGLVGRSTNTVSNSYATGNVTGARNYTGGLVGYQGVGTISNSYATGNVTGTNYVGGLVGYHPGGTLTNSYWYNRSQGLNCWNNVMGGFNIGCFAKVNENYFFNYENAPMNLMLGTGWNFNSIWSSSLNGTSYPKLKWQN